MSPTRRFQVALATALAAQVIVAVAMLSSRASGTDSALWGLPLDDGWIHLVYARNLISGFEVAFNPGEPEVGLTSPLWALLLSPLTAIGGHGAALAAKLLGLLAALATTVIAGLLARRIAGDLAGAVAAALVAVDPLFSFAAVSGMEVALASASTLGALLALISRRPLAAGALLGAAALTRPEALALTPLLLLWGFSMVRSGDLGRARALTGLAIAAAILAPFVSLCLAVTGRPLPNTAYIKGDLGLPGVDELGGLLQGVLMRSSAFASGAGLIAAGVAARRALREVDRDALGVLIAPWLLALSILATRSFPAEERETFYFTRYLIPALPLLAVGAGLGVEQVKRWGERRKKRRHRLQLIAAAGLGAVVLTVTTELPATVRSYSWNTQNIEEMQVAAGQWIARNTDDDAVVAASDVGAVRFFGERRVIDLMGLNYHPAVEARRRGQLPLGEIMRQERPTHLAVIPTWFPGLTRGGRAEVVFEARAQRYTVAAADQARFVVYRVRRY